MQSGRQAARQQGRQPLGRQAARQPGRQPLGSQAGRQRVERGRSARQGRERKHPAHGPPPDQAFNPPTLAHLDTFPSLRPLTLLAPAARRAASTAVVRCLGTRRSECER
eukprot:503574-Pleurochrysis_carterae.AAC.4